MVKGHRVPVGKITSPTVIVKEKIEHITIPLGLED